jgi:hypothetical protein
MHRAYLAGSEHARMLNGITWTDNSELASHATYVWLLTVVQLKLPR